MELYIYMLLHYYKSEEKSLPREIYIFVPHLRTARLVPDYLTIARYECRQWEFLSILVSQLTLRC